MIKQYNYFLGFPWSCWILVIRLRSWRIEKKWFRNEKKTDTIAELRWGAVHAMGQVPQRATGWLSQHVTVRHPHVACRKVSLRDNLYQRGRKITCMFYVLRELPKLIMQFTRNDRSKKKGRKFLQISHSNALSSWTYINHHHIAIHQLFTLVGLTGIAYF